MRLIINLCCFSLPPSLQVLGKGVGMEGEGGMEGRVEAEREEGPPISPSPSSKHWKKQAPAPSPNNPPALLWGLQESGCVGSGWQAGWSCTQLISCCILCPHIPAERPRECLFSHMLPPPSCVFIFPIEKVGKDVGSREGFPLKNAVSTCASRSVRIQLIM